jgi:hypothetical protein
MLQHPVFEKHKLKKEPTSGYGHPLSQSEGKTETYRKHKSLAFG